MRTFIALLLAISSATAYPADAAAGADPTCNVSTPPPDSGEGSAHSQLFKVYPRKSAIGARFNGCQSVWLYAPGRSGAASAPVEFMRFHFKHGKVVAVQIGNASCRYSRAGLPNSDNGPACPQTLPEVMPSQPAGCVQHSRSNTSDTCDDDE